MMPSTPDLLKETIVKTSRSGGKGGQNVNKVSSKVELVFNLRNTLLFTPEQKALLLQKLANRLDAQGNVHVVAQEDRSQLLNKQRAVIKLRNLMNKALQVANKRKPTQVPKSVVLKRLKSKAVQAQKKASRSQFNVHKSD